MSSLDWIVLLATLLLIVLYGVWKSRNNANIESYLLADRQMPWYLVGLSVMATQASAITFLSTPGLAYNKGMGFVQFYFGLPLAMIVLCVTFIPIFKKLNVYTAYEYLEQRFDLKTRALTSLLFLVQRGLSTGISIYAPAIILSTILQLDIALTTIIMGGVVVAYTVYGGAKAVSYTQMLQMVVIFGGLVVAGVMVVQFMPSGVGFGQALSVADNLGKMQVLDFHFDPQNQYNVWSGLVGGFFLQLSYFGTDQSQVGRYLTGKNTAESRMGLIMNGILKIPMQFCILLLGVLVFVFYQFEKPPVFFNSYELSQVKQSSYAPAFEKVEQQYEAIFEQKRTLHLSENQNNASQIKILQTQLDSLRKEASGIIKQNNPKADDKDYIFLNFVINYLPRGLVGLLIAVIFLASMGSLAAAFNSLSSATVIDFYQRIFHKQGSEGHFLAVSRWATVIWGVFCIGTAFFAHQVGNLIEAVNILGSWFYGTILGVFIVAFYCKFVKGTAVFYAAILAEICLIALDYFTNIAYLWFNPIGCLLVVGFGYMIEGALRMNSKT